MAHPKMAEEVGVEEEEVVNETYLCQTLGCWSSSCLVLVVGCTTLNCCVGFS